MLRLEESLKILDKECPIQENMIHIPVEESYGYIAAENIYSGINVPEFRKSAMDGYAIISQDTVGATKDNPTILEVIGEVMAGDRCECVINTGEAVRIMTGAMMPMGADCVIKQEDTDYGMDEVKVFKNIDKNSNYCEIGEDIKKDTLIIEKHTKLNSVHIGILSSVGINMVKVLAPMKVAILLTGSELLLPGKQLEQGKIYNSIGAMLKSKLLELKFDVVELSICKDEEEDVKSLLKQAAEKADVIITTGGVSVGKKDLIPEILSKIGAKILFHKVNIKPGTPVMASIYQGKTILSLSGNPFAALVTFEVFFSRIAANFMKNTSFLPVIGKAEYEGESLKANQQVRYVRAFAVNGKVKTETVHSSSVLSNMAMLNCFIIQPENTVIRSGQIVEIAYIHVR